MRRVGAFLRKYGFDVLIVIMAIEMALEVAIRYGAPTGPTSPEVVRGARNRAYCVAAPRSAALSLRRAAALWVLAAVISFVDGRLVVFTTAATSPVWLRHFCLAICLTARRPGRASLSCSVRR